MSTMAEVHIETLSNEPTPPTGETPTVGISTHRTTIAAVSIKLPPFWPADPTVWFTQVEAQFNTRGITSQKTRFNYVIASLSPEFAVEVRDPFIHPLAEDPYNTLKTEPIKHTATSK